jgi:hypothetical protein
MVYKHGGNVFLRNVGISIRIHWVLSEIPEVTTENNGPFLSVVYIRDIYIYIYINPVKWTETGSDP